MTVRAFLARLKRKEDVGMEVQLKVYDDDEERGKVQGKDIANVHFGSNLTLTNTRLG